MEQECMWRSFVKTMGNEKDKMSRMCAGRMTLKAAQNQSR